MKNRTPHPSPCRGPVTISPGRGALIRQVADLRRAVRYLAPLAEAAAGGYPPEAMAEIRDNIKAAKKLERECAPKKP